MSTLLDVQVFNHRIQFTSHFHRELIVVALNDTLSCRKTEVNPLDMFHLTIVAYSKKSLLRMMASEVDSDTIGMSVLGIPSLLRTRR